MIFRMLDIAVVIGEKQRKSGIIKIISILFIK